MAQKINVRFGELLEPQDLIRIDSTVREIAEAVQGFPEEGAVWALWDYVCQKVEYPNARPGLAPDRHILSAFPTIDVPFCGVKYRVKKSNDEFWQFPSETLAWGVGDCEDTSILLASLLRAYGIPPERVAVEVGEISQGRHCWVQLDRNILETTLSSAPTPPWRVYGEYVPAWAFNDIMVAGEIVFIPVADEREKLRQIGALWGHPTKV